MKVSRPCQSQGRHDCQERSDDVEEVRTRRRRTLEDVQRTWVVPADYCSEHGPDKVNEYVKKLLAVSFVFGANVLDI